MRAAHCELEIWQEAMQLVREIYRITRELPADERFGLTSQMRRAAVSIPSNIAEGAARRTRAEFIHFLHVARGSLMERDTQLQVCAELDFLASTAMPAEATERLFAKLNAFIHYQQTRKARPS